jgi:RHS repeat-associated protein
LIGITGYDASSRAMDANGNTSAFQANGWMYGLGYNDANRLSLVQQNGSTIVAYRLDGKGERVRKLPAGATATEYVYNEAGRLLYEYTSPSQNRAYIWADDTLVATVEDNATIHYVYTDHLGTPRVLTTTSGTPIWAWPWLQNPFGEKPASGAGGYTFNLRYPGQYYDQETGLNYNGRRDYESGTGRYVESDPIGLAGGINPYAYVQNRPLSMFDFYGLSPEDSSQWRECMQYTMGSNLCQYIYGFGEAAEWEEKAECQVRKGTKCVAVCALKKFIGETPAEVYGNALQETAKLAVERVAKEWALKAVEHVIPYVGWGQTIYDGGRTFVCSWKCIKQQ